MGEAFVSVVAALGIEHDEVRREFVAHLIVELASGSDELDAITLRDKAIALLTPSKSA